MGHYQLDADTYAHDWQVDYLKVDFCGPVNLKYNIAPPFFQNGAEI